MNIKPLLAYWHSVDLPQVITGLSTIPCDQIHISYFPYPYPHRIAENYFKEHKEYTHLILVPNDLIPTLEHYKQMLEFTKSNYYDVSCGVCNVDLDKESHSLNVCFKLPLIPYLHRKYRWLAESQRLHLLKNNVNKIQVGFAGFPFMWVKRSVLEKVRINWLRPELQGQSPPIWETDGGYSNDLAFCHNLNLENIPIWCNLECKMLHLRYQGEQQIGKKPENITFFKWNEQTKTHEQFSAKEQISKLCEKST